MPIKLTTNPVKLLGGPTPKSVIQEMVTAYKNDLKANGDITIRSKFPSRASIGQSSSIWISVNELIQLITDNRANGIRIYFGQHNQSSLPSGKEEYEDLLTAIFVATRDTTNFENPTYQNSEDQLNEDSDPEKANSFSVAGPFEGQGADKVPICNPSCPTGKMMKLII